MKKIYKNDLPKGTEVESTNIKVENGQIFVEVEFKEKFHPKIQTVQRYADKQEKNESLSRLEIDYKKCLGEKNNANVKRSIGIYEKYWYIGDDLRVDFSYFSPSFEYDMNRLKANNCFLKEGIAKRYARIFQKILKNNKL